MHIPHVEKTKNMSISTPFISEINKKMLGVSRGFRLKYLSITQHEKMGGSPRVKAENISRSHLTYLDKFISEGIYNMINLMDCVFGKNIEFELPAHS